MLLEQISPSDPVTLAGLRGFLETAPILRDMQFYSRQGAADSVKRGRLDTKGAVSKFTRSLNEAHTAASPPTPVYDPVTKKIAGWESQVDKILEQRNEDAMTELAQESYYDGRNNGWVFQNMFFNGDAAADAEDWDGVVNLVDAAWILSGANNGGLLMPVGKSDAVAEAQQLAIERFKQQAARIRGGATHVYMNEDAKIRWVTIAKAQGYYNQIQTLDGVIETIAGVIIRGAGYSLAGPSLLPFTESDGLGNSNTSSLYFCRWGERTDLTVLTSMGLVGEYAGLSGNFYTNNFNMDAVMHLQEKTALVRAKGWRLVQA